MNKKDIAEEYAIKEYERLNDNDPIFEDNLCFQLLILLPFLVLYMAFAFVIWDIAWVENCEWILRVFYLLVCVLISLAISVDM